METLSAPEFNNISTSSTDDIPPPTVNGIFTFSATCITNSANVFLFCSVAVISKKTNSSAPFSAYISANSTGSPASRKSTKFTPFTVRPFLISKQGIILFVSIVSSPCTCFRVSLFYKSNFLNAGFNSFIKFIFQS